MKSQPTVFYSLNTDSHCEGNEDIAEAGAFLGGALASAENHQANEASQPSC
jgi:hypothetical protein